jgi:hypothetical protein
MRCHRGWRLSRRSRPPGWFVRTSCGAGRFRPHGGVELPDRRPIALPLSAQALSGPGHCAIAAKGRSGPAYPIAFLSDKGCNRGLGIGGSAARLTKGAAQHLQCHLGRQSSASAALRKELRKTALRPAPRVARKTMLAGDRRHATQHVAGRMRRRPHGKPVLVSARRWQATWRPAESWASRPPRRGAPRK